MGNDLDVLEWHLDNIEEADEKVRSAEVKIKQSSIGKGKALTRDEVVRRKKTAAQARRAEIKRERMSQIDSDSDSDSDDEYPGAGVSRGKPGADADAKMLVSSIMNRRQSRMSRTSRAG